MDGIKQETATGNNQEYTWWQKVLTELPDNAADILGALKGNGTYQGANNQTQLQKANDNTMLIVIVVAFLVLVVMAMFIFKRK